MELHGQVVPALVALREPGLEPLALEAKEGLALLNGTQLMSALGALLLADADRLVRTASVAAAMSVEALLGTDVAFAAAYQLARPHPGQVAVAAELRWLLRDCTLQASHHASPHKVQDPYSLRCVPQVHGAVRDALDHLRRVLDIEMNSATDNPLVFPDGGGVPTRRARDRRRPRDLAAATSTASRSRSRSTSRSSPSRSWARSASGGPRCSLDPRLNGGLPAFLAPDPGRNSGLMILQYTAAALASENKVLAHPPSADSIPTWANQEDHVSMGADRRRATPARSSGTSSRSWRSSCSCAAQALDLRLAQWRPRARPPRRARASPRPTAASASVVRPSAATASRARTSRP